MSEVQYRVIAQVPRSSGETAEGVAKRLGILGITLEPHRVGALNHGTWIYRGASIDEARKLAKTAQRAGADFRIETVVAQLE